MTGIKWQEPPTDGRTAGWKEIADELRSKPGEWALVREETSRATQANIAQARLKAFAPAGSFEATSRNRREANGRTVFDIYARFIGEQVAR